MGSTTHLKTGEEFYLNADDVMPTASLIKLPVMVEAYWQADEGKVRLTDLLTLKKDPKVGGPGILVHNISAGTCFPRRVVARLMIVCSNNISTTKLPLHR